MCSKAITTIFLFWSSQTAINWRTGALLRPSPLVHIAGVTRTALAHSGVPNYSHRLDIPSSSRLRRRHYSVFKPLKQHIEACITACTLWVARAVTFGNVEEGRWVCDPCVCMSCGDVAFACGSRIDPALESDECWRRLWKRRMGGARWKIERSLDPPLNTRFMARAISIIRNWRYAEIHQNLTADAA